VATLVMRQAGTTGAMVKNSSGNATRLPAGGRANRKTT